MHDRDVAEFGKAALDGRGACRFGVGEQNLQHDR
jgi:hypothetical protein